MSQINKSQDKIVKDLTKNCEDDDILMSSMGIKGNSARKPIVDMISRCVNAPKKFEQPTDYLEFYRVLRNQFVRLGFEQDFIKFEENKIAETGKT